MPLPPIEEQKAMAAYLDSVIAEIDKAIAQQQRMIDLLNERKQIIIQNAVTKGLDPDVQMKDSGEEWLGTIPGNWKLLKGRSIFKENKEKNGDRPVEKVLSLSYGKIIVKKDIDEGLVPSDYKSYQIVRPNDIIIRCTDLQNDKTSLRTAIAKENGIITGAYLGLSVNPHYCPDYLHYYLHTWDITKELYRYGGGLRQSLSWEDIKLLTILVPPIEEQIAISSFIDIESAKIEKEIERIKSLIEQLKERKRIIINDVVTGKIKVS